jgi:hypothetical protein
VEVVATEEAVAVTVAVEAMVEVVATVVAVVVAMEEVEASEEAVVDWALVWMTASAGTCPDFLSLRRTFTWSTLL